MESNGWVPLISLSSNAGRRAWDVVCAFAEQHTGADMALLDAYLFLADGDEQRMQRAVKRLNTAIADVDGLCSMGRWGLHGGLAGLGWIVEHVSRIRDGRGGGDLNAHTDAALSGELQRGRWRGSCDLESGLAGIGVYFLERLPSDRAAENAALVIAHLESISRVIGVSGMVPAGLELDVARGLPGLCHFLSAAVVCGMEPEKAQRMLDESILWIERQDGTGHSTGAAAAFLEIARRIDRQDYRDSGRRLLERSLHPGGNDEDLMSAHALNRIFQSEQDPRCREMALSSLDKTEFPRDAAVALALLAAVTPVEPAWDQRLAMSWNSSGRAEC